MYTIIGSGFGLYGYLPALMESGHAVVLPEVYRDIVNARQDMAPYRSRVIWVRGRDEALSRAAGAVLAVRPEDQPALVSECLRHPNLQRLLLEKPLAPSPAQAAMLLQQLRFSGCRFRLGYIFLIMDLQSVLRDASKAGREAWSLDWTFMAHHFSQGLDSWKKHDPQGGGVIRFYGIHLLASLSSCGYDSVEMSQIEGAEAEVSERWEAAFGGPGKPNASVTLDSRCERRSFVIHRGKKRGMQIVLSRSDPFAEDSPTAFPGQDPRVSKLMELVQSFEEPDEPLYDLYGRINALWQDVENKSHFSLRCARC